jgi:hypothetical protein
MTADIYGKRAGEALRRTRLHACLGEEVVAQRVRELGGEASASDVHRWECGADYPAWVLMMLYEQAGLSPDHVAQLLNHPPALFRRAYGLISGEARPI